MALGARENGTIAAFVGLATAAFLVLDGRTPLPDVARWAVLIGVGVVNPGWLTRHGAD